MFHPQWWYVIKSFCLRPQNGRDLNTLLPTQFCELVNTSWKATSIHFFIPQGISNVVPTSPGFWKLRCKLYGCNLLAVSNAFISTLNQSGRDSHCWPARTMRLSELCLAFLTTCNLWSLMTTSAVINNTDTTCILTAYEWSLLSPSLPQKIRLTNPLFKTHITIPCHLDNPCARARKCFVPQCCSSQLDIRNQLPKKLHTFPGILTEVY